MARKHYIINRLIHALAEADRLWTEREALLRGDELSCRAGCFGCCVGLFAITFGEALAIRGAVAELGPGARAAVRRRAAAIVERSASWFPGDATAGVLDPEREDPAEDTWLAAVRDTPCPALDLSSGRCLVYAARPTTCRTYGVALASEGEVLLPACDLNLPLAPPARVSETAIDAGRLARVDHALAEIAASAGLPAGAETTVAHALTGAVFSALDGGKG
jgi:Fe-S-cluster containining protein